MLKEEVTSRSFSRREFLRKTGVFIGGTTMALASACGSKSTSYTATVGSPPTLTLGTTDSIVASDRKYSLEHIWVLSISGGRVVIGITDKLRRLLGTLDHIGMEGVGIELEKGQTFGLIGGEKMNLELTSPVSGKIVQTNDDLVANTMPLNLNPYTKWLEVIELSKPEEVEELLTPEEYAELQAKTLGQYND
jgi:glycine cleavage system H protein